MKSPAASNLFSTNVESHPARGAWIEIHRVRDEGFNLAGRTPQGVRGLKYSIYSLLILCNMSHPARGAWIEMKSWTPRRGGRRVAPRKGCVD